MTEYGRIHTDGSRSGGQPTQADIDAAESIFWVETIIDDHEAVAKAFARHRQYGYDQGYYDGCTRQSTQSDALLEGDAQTILYLLGVRRGREDERAKIAAEASQPTQSDALRVTDEMVERAAIAFYNDPPGSGRSINDAMKAALIAALQEQSK